MMDTAPLVSVIVPVYNAGDYLANCIRSLTCQSFSDFELLLIDDGSTDDSPSICDNFSQQDSRIVTVHKKNGGASQARNTGIDLAKSELICFVDADDAVCPNFLRELYDDYRRVANTDFVIQGLTQEYPDKDIVFQLHDHKYEMSSDAFVFFKDVKIIDYSGPYCKVFRKSILDENGIRFCKEIVYGEDLDFILRYLLFCRIVTSSSATNYRYIMHSGSVSSRYYSFDIENRGMQRLYGSFFSLTKLYPSLDLMNMMVISIRAYLWRLIYSNYHFSYTRHQRIKHFYGISDETIDFLVCRYKSESLFTTIIRKLFAYRCFRIMDVLLSFAYKRY